MNKHRCHSHYETLRIERQASPQRVRTAYRRLAQKFHPDKHAGRVAAANLMVLINEAYKVLSDPQQRSSYDDWLAAEEARMRSGGGSSASTVAFVPDRWGWAVWLLWVIVSIAVLTVGYVLLRSIELSPAPPLKTLAGQPAELPDTPPVPQRPVQPWTEPARSTIAPNPETDPVTRLVREGTIQPAPAGRMRETATR